MEQSSPKSPRFSDTPPGSPKSCMKGARKQLTFDQPDVPVTSGSGGNPSPSPKRSPKSVSIRMHDDGDSGSGSPRVTSFDAPSMSEGKKKKPPPEEIKFQFELTQHYDQSTPPPNCTSNGNYEFEQQEEQQTSSTSQTTYDDPRKDPQLVEIATKFVNDIIENAKVEAANRAKADPSKAPPGTSAERDSFSNGMGRGAGVGQWYRRAHGLVSKWITNICVRAQNIRADLK